MPVVCLSQLIPSESTIPEIESEDASQVVELPWFQSRLVTWWEMEQFSARGFFNAGLLIRGLESECYIASFVGDPDAPLFNQAAPLDERVVSRALDYLPKIAKECDSIGLSLSAGTVRDAIKRLEAGPAHPSLNYQWLQNTTQHLRSLIAREMEQHGFFYISPEKGKYWMKMDERHPFGDAVADAFPSTLFDAAQAGMCVAIGVSTASVFHSMRVLEIGLCVFGALFGVSLAHTNWEPALREIESKIRELHKDPAWKARADVKEKQEVYAQAASHFAVLKDAWRNYTMHSRGKHTEDEAEMIFLNVRGFMRKLVEMGLKEPE